MLSFEDCGNQVSCVDKSGSQVAYLYLANCGRYLIDDVDPLVTSDELRQIADKLDELNKAR